MTLNPRESGEFIAKETKNITIHQKGIEKLGNLLIEEINTGKLSTANFTQNKFHPKSDDPKAVDWLFVVDTLNYCFWTPSNKKKWKVEGETGYFALCAAINRAVKENIDILNPHFYGGITEEQLGKILRSDTKTEVPLLKERVKSLHEAGKVLVEKYQGSFANVVREVDGSAVKLLASIVDNFPMYRDEADYKNKRVSLYKRAQILVGDVWACFRNNDIGRFTDIDEITMFADYRVPQSLLYFDVFEYGEELQKALKDSNNLKNGDELEVEIRGCSIKAVEDLREYVRTRLLEGKEINSILIDHFLWDFRRKNAKEIEDMKLPFHKTFCVYY